jgi:hypothetical protein
MIIRENAKQCLSDAQYEVRTIEEQIAVLQAELCHAKDILREANTHARKLEVHNDPLPPPSFLFRGGVMVVPNNEDDD